MQEIRLDNTEVLTENPAMLDLLKAIENPNNKEVRLIPDISEPKKFYTIKKNGKWVQRKY